MRFSISQIKCFKSCRRMYELKYVEGVEPIVKSDALQLGTNYHELIEQLYSDNKTLPNDLSKESAMARAYQKYIMPKINMKAVEEWQDYDLGDGDQLFGRVDGIAIDGNIVEHKTTSAVNLDSYEYDLLWDEQILAYMLMTGKRKIWYTVCRKPNIRQCKNETEEDFFDRMIKWFDDDTNSKIRLIEVTRTDQEVEQFENDLKMMISELKHCTDNQAYYKNTNYCNCWGRRCEYSPICLHYNPDEEYIEFERVERRKD